MPRIIERLGDKLLSRVLAKGTAAAQTCYKGPSYCTSPSNACSCRACQLDCWVCAGHQTCHFTGACC